MLLLSGTVLRVNMLHEYESLRIFCHLLGDHVAVVCHVRFTIDFGVCDVGTYRANSVLGIEFGHDVITVL